MSKKSFVTLPCFKEYEQNHFGLLMEQKAKGSVRYYNDNIKTQV